MSAAARKPQPQRSRNRSSLPKLAPVRMEHNYAVVLGRLYGKEYAIARDLFRMFTKGPAAAFWLAFEDCCPPDETVRTVTRDRLRRAFTLGWDEGVASVKACRS